MMDGVGAGPLRRPPLYPHPERMLAAAGETFVVRFVARTNSRRALRVRAFATGCIGSPNHYGLFLRPPPATPYHRGTLRVPQWRKSPSCSESIWGPRTRA